MKDLDSFTIGVNGLTIDFEFSKNNREKYYELCWSQDTFLHDNLRECINIKLVAGAISKTVDFADAIKASKLSTPQQDFAAWEKTLGVLVKLGMKVYFLHARRGNKLIPSQQSSRRGINIKLAAGAISETVFAAWEKTLGMLEKLGMSVYFLRARKGSRLNVL
ncbi:hypothetical protein IFM89_000835 [Coptis chinensis]|uniref:Uncharacterized protein n=1 Tax=Coptis chinensis TaxID=261450 RepID=A0A835ITF9_9MAGN|nr:hypothetical protein IFM89_000835 [Coptis chinensis]